MNDNISVRSETGISKGAVSISSAAAEFSQMTLSKDCKIDSGIKDANIAIIGAVFTNKYFSLLFFFSFLNDRERCLVSYWCICRHKE